ncbi:MAG: hypothetical protein DIU55_001490 [Bacillota bacterium]
MYVTHGDTIVFRSDQRERFGTSSRAAWVGPPGRHGGPAAYRGDPPPAPDGEERLEALRRRIAALEERLARLEARLARSDGHPGARADGPWPDDRERPGARSAAGSRRPAGQVHTAGGGSGQVRVAAHAPPGVHVSVGQVRLKHS